MLISNLWVDTELVNSVISTFNAICYQIKGPPDLSLAVSYTVVTLTSHALSSSTDTT